jgi:membrane-bound metal-dependent hydrolase YbcI (DUF457 family)
VLGTQLIDVLWAGCVLLGIEHLRLDPSLPSNPLDLYHMPYTHSLVAALGWAVLAAVAARARWGARGVALAIGAVVASHWLLDWLVHRPDLPLWPGSPKVGLGFWDHPVGAFVLELTLLLGAAWLLAGRVRFGRGVLVLAGALATLQAVVTLAPPSLGPAGVALTLLLLFATVTLAALRIEGAGS